MADLPVRLFLLDKQGCDGTTAGWPAETTEQWLRQRDTRVLPELNDRTYRTAINLIHHVKDLLLAFGLSLVFINVAGGGEREGCSVTCYTIKTAFIKWLPIPIKVEEMSVNGNGYSRARLMIVCGL